jgi:hypothetical protein
MESDQPQAVTGNGKPGQATSRAIGSYPKWKRGVALFWVLIICAVTGVAGLLAASLFSTSARSVSPISFSGY